MILVLAMRTLTLVRVHLYSSGTRPMAYLLCPSQSTRIAQVTIPRRSSPPLRSLSRMAIRAILLQASRASSPLPLLLRRNQRLHLLRQQTIPLLHLPELKLPARAAHRLELVEHVVIRRKTDILSANSETGLSSMGYSIPFRGAIYVWRSCVSCRV